jgi:hypothetical protein
MCHVHIIPHVGDVRYAAESIRAYDWVDKLKIMTFLGFDTVRRGFEPQEEGIFLTTNVCSPAIQYAGDPVTKLPGVSIQGTAEHKYRFSMRLRVSQGHGSLLGAALSSAMQAVTAMNYGSLTTGKQAAHYIHADSWDVLSRIYTVLRSLDTDDVDGRYSRPLFGQKKGVIPVFRHPCSDVIFAAQQREQLLRIPGINRVYTLVDL